MLRDFGAYGAVLCGYTAGAIAVIGFWHYYLVGSWTRDGEVEANVVDLSPHIFGRIIRIPVRDNQTVRKGDILYEIDPADFQIAVDVAAANVQSTLADATLKRAEAAGRAKLTDLAISPEEQEIYGSAAKVAEASYKLAVARLNEGTPELTADQSGVDCKWLRDEPSPAIGRFRDARRWQYIHSGTRIVFGLPAISKRQSSRILELAIVQWPLSWASRDPVYGHVESVARGINIPNESRGNLGLASVSPVFSWVRLAQRIPVRVHIDSVPKTVELAVGMTATVSVGPDASPSSWHGWISRAAAALFQGH
ncbi:MAG: biotin/lipoyl-binding protein [Methylovirgula sp.]